MSKSEQTREKIISKAALLFNQQGYSGTSISDIMHATGLEKGGIYNHFSSKDDIALAAFDYAYQQQSESYAAALKAVRGQPRLQLQAVIDTFIDVFDDPVMSGGCIIMNTAIESDDSHPALKARAAAAMDEWRDLIQRIVRKGIDKGVFRPQTDPFALASVFVATLEGGLMLSKLYNDMMYIHNVAQHLHRHIEQHVFI